MTEGISRIAQVIFIRLIRIVRLVVVYKANKNSVCMTSFTDLRMCCRPVASTGTAAMCQMAPTQTLTTIVRPTTRAFTISSTAITSALQVSTVTSVLSVIYRQFKWSALKYCWCNLRLSDHINVGQVSEPGLISEEFGRFSSPELELVVCLRSCSHRFSSLNQTLLKCL